MTDKFYELILPLDILLSLFIAELLIKFIQGLNRTFMVQFILVAAITVLFVLLQKTFGFEVEGENL